MPSLETKPLLLDVHRITLRIDGKEFEKLCQDNRDRSFELTATGELIVMPPVGGESGNSELELGAEVELSRWEALTPEQRTKFPPLAPDFVIELLSATDRLPPLREKMEEYKANGVRLGLLINPKNKQVEIYRSSLDDAQASGQAPQISESPTSLVEDLPLAIDCSEIMPGFILSMSEIWQP